MKAEVAFTPLLAAARALKPYTTPQSRHTPTRPLYLHASGDTLTLSATTGRETASVPLFGAVSDGWTAVAPDALIKALTTIKPSRKAANTATVTVHGEADRLHLSVGDGPTVGLDTDTPAADPPTVPAVPARQERSVTRGPVAHWCDLVAGAAVAASREPARPDLAVVRLLRDQARVVLMVEAASGYRVHRGTWGEPDGNLVDVRMPAEAAQRAVRLLNAIDPSGQIRVHADEQQVLWRTDRVRLAANTGGSAFPNLEKVREDLLDDAAVIFTVNRGELLAALETARRLAARPAPAGTTRTVRDGRAQRRGQHRLRRTHVHHTRPFHRRDRPDPAADPQPRLRTAGHRVPRRRPHPGTRDRRPATDLPARRRPPRDPHADRRLAPAGGNAESATAHTADRDSSRAPNGGVDRSLLRPAEPARRRRTPSTASTAARTVTGDTAGRAVHDLSATTEPPGPGGA